MRAGPQPIEIELDKPRKLLLTVGGLKAAQITLNKTRDYQPPRAIFRIMMEELPKVETGDIGIDFCEAIIWASMLHEDRNLALDDVGFLLPITGNEAIQLTVRIITETYMRLEKTEEAPIEEKKNLMKLNGIATSGVSPEST
jgi:hypothetical protein